MPKVTPKCEWCDQPGEFLCDFVVVTTPKAKRPEDRVTTCSRAFCAAHRHLHSSGIACSRGRKPCCQRYSIDYCPDHAPRQEPAPVDTLRTLYFDGAAEPNPGLASWGWCVVSESGKVLAEGSGVVEQRPTTNNVAEYYALGWGLRHLAEDRQTRRSLLWVEAGQKLLIRGDSKLVIEQLTGGWACNKDYLQRLRKRCLDLLQELGCEWSAEWIPREQNARADALSVAAWEVAAGKRFPVRQRHERG